MLVCAVHVYLAPGERQTLNNELSHAVDQAFADRDGTEPVRGRCSLPTFPSIDQVRIRIYTD